jgi:mono/diheme cytochrome c family protein
MLLSLCVAALALQQAPARPVVAAYERFDTLPPEEAGRLLLGELACTACHADPAIPPKKGPSLADVGGRLRAEWLRAWLADPQKAKPGTTMPRAAKAEDVEPLVHYLLSLGKPVALSAGAGQKGHELFHQAGCVACHAPLDGGDVKGDKGVVPLGKPAEKWRDPAALAAFLLDPLKWRPSGRMPKLNLTPQEAMSVAVRLVGAPALEPESGGGFFEPGLEWEAFQGAWSKLPDFDALKPYAKGVATSFDAGLAKREDGFALRFRGFLEVPKDGLYTFTTTSDDGSRLLLGKTVIVDNDGVHGGTEAAGTRQLKKGRYLLTVEYFEASGGEELAVTWEGPGFGKRKIDPKALSHGAIAAAREVEPSLQPFTPDPALIAKGRELFQALRCASCHAAEPKLTAPASRPLATLRTGAGCTVVQYPLDARQAASIEAAMKAAPKEADAALRIDRTMLALNCYGCHERGGKGGAEAGRSAFFVGQDQTIGDEGRLPPHLNGVGAKLRPEWLKTVLQQGTKVRPYVFTRMPAFGHENVAGLVDDLLKADPAPAEPAAPPRDKAMIAAGRQLTGTKGMSCVSCHQFQGHKSQGIPGMDLVHMTTRLRKDWFVRYLLEPASLRPGTRMPTFWPEGKSVRKDILDGDTPKQIDALWAYLGEGGKAQLPLGIGPQPILLAPTPDEAVIYRNFIQGAGPRAIAVGYPEKANLAFDANQMCLKLLWHGDFIDASKHWVDRGSGFQGPAGDKVVSLPDGPPFATAPAAAWPKESGKAAGYQFGGYELDKKGRPTFLYAFKGVQVRDFFEALPGAEPAFRRTLLLEAKEPTADLVFRAAGKGEAKVEGAVEGGGEYRVPVHFEDGKARIVVTYRW